AASRSHLELAPTGGISSCFAAAQIEQPGRSVVPSISSLFCPMGQPLRRDYNTLGLATFCKGGCKSLNFLEAVARSRASAEVSAPEFSRSPLPPTKPFTDHHLTPPLQNVAGRRVGLCCGKQPERRPRGQHRIRRHDAALFHSGLAPKR